jgi:hypothetical protein
MVPVQLGEGLVIKIFVGCGYYLQFGTLLEGQPVGLATDDANLLTTSLHVVYLILSSVQVQGIAAG